MAVDFKSKIKPQPPYIVVDGACENNPGPCYYKVVFVHQINGVTKLDIIYRMGPLAGGTNNIAEFLGLVHALAHCAKKGLEYPVYSDSQTAIAWVNKGRMNTTNEWDVHNHQLHELCVRAEAWLVDNPQRNEVRKWETKYWGENPADFGNKR